MNHIMRDQPIGRISARSEIFTRLSRDPRDGKPANSQGYQALLFREGCLKGPKCAGACHAGKTASGNLMDVLIAFRGSRRRSAVHPTSAVRRRDEP
jgi:hypothetical protein